jgi:hypothetical protein
VDIAAWLRGLGLGQYESAFRANDVDAQVLPRLTAEDLISIGVTSVGHRRRLLDAIVALGAEAPPATVPIPAVAERRQLRACESFDLGSKLYHIWRVHSGSAHYILWPECHDD